MNFWNNPIRKRKRPLQAPAVNRFYSVPRNYQDPATGDATRHLHNKITRYFDFMAEPWEDMHVNISQESDGSYTTSVRITLEDQYSDPDGRNIDLNEAAQDLLVFLSKHFRTKLRHYETKVKEYDVKDEDLETPGYVYIKLHEIRRLPH